MKRRITAKDRDAIVTALRVPRPSIEAIAAQFGVGARTVRGIAAASLIALPLAMPVPSERQVQRSILRMAERCFPDVVIHHSPNGAHLSGDTRARCMQIGALKGDGMRPGWPDLIAVWDRGVAFLEVKRPKGGKVSPEQLAMHQALAERGYAVAVVTSPEEAWQHLADRGAPVRARIAA